MAMSGKIMGLVWEMELPHGEKYVLLAMADHADHEGNHVRPSVDLICWKTDYSERQVRRLVGQLRKRRILIVTAKATNRRPAEYRIDVNAAPRKPARLPERDDTMAPQEDARPDTMAPQKKQRGHGDTSRPDTMAPQRRAKKAHGGHGDTSRGAIMMSPDPSWNHDHDHAMPDQRERESRARAHEHWAVVEWLGAFPQIRLTDEQAQLIAEQVTNHSAWTLTRQDYMGSPRWKRDNIGNVLDRYKRHVKDLSDGRQTSPSAGLGASQRRNGRRDDATDWAAIAREHFGSAEDDE
jgi:hypothetical protein